MTRAAPRLALRAMRAWAPPVAALALAACRRDAPPLPFAPSASASAPLPFAPPASAATPVAAPEAGGDAGEPAQSTTRAPIQAPAATALLTHRASFDVSAVRLTIEDVHMSVRLDDVLARTSAELVVNGGFFGIDGSPLGLAISEGKTLSRYSKDMSGGVLWVRDGVAHLSATEDYEAAPADFAVQCRPRLVVGSRVNLHGDDGRRARRTAICLRDGGRSIEFVAATGIAGGPEPTLFALATELAALGCEEALNLDGGPSTGWASRGDGGVTYEPPRAPVRHAIAVRIP